MKLLITVSILCFGLNSFATTFDAFLGEYQVVGDVSVDYENTDYCERFGFSGLHSLKVEKAPGGYHRTHKVTFHSDWKGMDLKSFHPIAEYKNLNDGFVNYAETTGAANVVMNERATLMPKNRSADRFLVVGMEKVDNSLFVFVNTSLKRNGELLKACHYRAELRNK